MTFAVIAEGTGPLTVDALTSALARAQREHAMLRARMVADAEGWLRLEWAEVPSLSVQIVQPKARWRDSLAEAVHPSFGLGAPAVRAVMMRLDPDRWVFALAFHHSIADARSACSLLAEVLRNASDARLPPATRPTPPAMLQRFGARCEPAAVDAFKAKRKAVVERYGALDVLPGFELRLGPTTPRFETLTFEPGFVDRLAARCRDHHTSVHGALCAAQLLALRAAFPGASPRTLALTSPCDLRSPVTDDDSLSLCTTLLGAPYRVEAGALWPLAREVIADLKAWLAEGDGPMFFSLFPPRPAVASEVNAFRQSALQRPHGSVVSNVGRLRDVDSGQLRVDAMSFVLFPTVTQALFTAATTYRGILQLNVCYDDGRLPSGLASTLTAALDKNLRDAAS